MIRIERLIVRLAAAALRWAERRRDKRMGFVPDDYEDAEQAWCSECGCEMYAARPGKHQCPYCD